MRDGARILIDLLVPGCAIEQEHAADGGLWGGGDGTGAQAMIYFFFQQRLA
jgi:hypothetical protein